MLTDVLQTWVVFSFFVGLAHSYPERICQIRVILALISGSAVRRLMFISVAVTVVATQAVAVV